MGFLFDLIFTLRILKYVSVSKSLSDVVHLVEIAKGEACSSMPLWLLKIVPLSTVPKNIEGGLCILVSTGCF